MTSIHTNRMAVASLDTLRSIDARMSGTQARVSSGYRVGEASDNAAYWSIATTMRSDNKALSAVEDALGLGAASVDTAYTGMDAAVDIMSEFKAKLVAAREPGIDKTKINSELTELKSQLRSIAASASFAGENWLWRQSAADDGPKQIVGSFTRDSAGNVAVEVISYDMAYVTDTSTVYHLIDDLDGDSGILTNSGFGDELGVTDWVVFNGENHQIHAEMNLTATTTDTAIEEMISVADMMLQRMIDVTAELGSIKMRVSMQQEFVADLRDTLETGIGRLVDADMNEESTRLKALQVQQQLGIQSLSIANAASDAIMSLFQ